MKNPVKAVQIVVLCFMTACIVSARSDDPRPNILIIMTDQQSADVMSCVLGDKYLHTPNIDMLAREGIRFSRAYSPNPLCLPMRTSMMTGRFPHENGVLTNSDVDELDPSKNVFLGKLFKDAGYETAYFGKWHVALDIKKQKIHGFDLLCEESCKKDPSNSVKGFFDQKHDKPFLVVASMLSPHEICQWSRRQKLPGSQLGPVPPTEKLPPLRLNHFPPQNETDIISYMRKSYQAHRLFPVAQYTDDDWRRLTWGYYRLIERVDSLLGTMLDALKHSGHEENTIVVFLSDHGDCCGSHKWNQKTVFYDESARVPFIISWAGHLKSRTSEALVNTGTDIIPTVCEFAGIDIAPDMPGKSLVPIVLGKPKEWDRNYLVSQNHMVQNKEIDGIMLQPHGRMVRSTNFYY